MYQFSYDEILEDSAQDARARERLAFDKAISLLEAAEEKGADSPESIQATYFLQRLWMALMEDLASEDNALSEKLRASLLSIGIWMLKEVDEIRAGRVATFRPLIDINRIIREGIR